MNPSDQVDVKFIEKHIRYNCSAFGAWALPETVNCEFPPYYVWLWEQLIEACLKLNGGEEQILRYALGLPRGFAKTTFMKLFVSYCILYKLRRYILIVCATEDLVKAFIRDVDNILQSKNIKEVYFDWQGAKFTDTMQIKEAKIEGKNYVLQGIGAGTGIRGANRLDMRPDMILNDDSQTREHASSEAARKTDNEWFFSTLLKTVERDGALLMYVGNMYNKWCILHLLQKSDQWTSLITGAILRDGDSIWPEFRSVESIMKEFKHDSSVGFGDIFFAEVQNLVDADGLAGILENCRFEVIPKLDREEYDGGAVIIDPADFKTESDDNAIAVSMFKDSIGHIVELEAGNFHPKEVIKIAIDFALKWRICCIAIESVAYQGTLVLWMRETLKEMGLSDSIQVVELLPGNRSKNTRIVGWMQAMFDKLYEICDFEILAKIEWEARNYIVERTNNKDDCLDVCAYAPQVLDKYRHIWMRPQEDTMAIAGAMIENVALSDGRARWR